MLHVNRIGPLAAFLVLALAACDTRAVIDEPVIPSPSPIDCPAGPTAGAEDLIPLVPGETWRFKYSAEVRGGSQPAANRGTMALTLHAYTCDAGIRTMTGEEVRTGTQWIYDPIQSAWTEAPYESRQTVRIVETAEGVRFPWFEGTVARYHPEGTSIVRVEPGADGSCGASSATLMAPGLIRYAGGCSQGSTTSSFGLTRLTEG
jgi:hypothetical protein